MAHTHDIIDMNTMFTVLPLTREIESGGLKLHLVQHDHNSERLTFEVPRYVEGHDMSLCTKVTVHYNNISADKKNESRDVYIVDDVQVNPADNSVVTFSWLISCNATRHAGILSFLICFECLTGTTIDYAWHTALYSDIKVGEGMSNDEAVITEYSDVLEKWKQDILEAFDAEFDIVQNMGNGVAEVMSQKATSDIVSRIAKNVDASAELCGNFFPLSPSAWEQGSIDNTGAEVSNSRRIRTDYISTKDIASLRFKTNAKKTVRISIVYYTLSDGAYTRISESGWKTEDTEFPAVGRYDAIRIVGSTVTDGEINPLDVISLYSGASLTIEKNVDKDDIRIMQYNIGRYNYGLSGGLSDDKIQTKIANYKKFFGKHRPDIVCLQEYERYMDNSETISADEVLFGELFPYLPESHYPSIFRSSIPYARYDSDSLGNNDTSTRVRYTLAQYSIKRKKVAVLSTALYYNNAESRAVQFNEAMALLSKFDYAIVCADMNYASQEEMDSLLQIASDNGFKACNGGFFGTFDTLNTSQYFKPIDNILVKGDVIIRNVFVPDVYENLSSDHYPVIADIRIK